MEEGALVSPWSLVMTRLTGLITAIRTDPRHKLKHNIIIIVIQVVGAFEPMIENNNGICTSIFNW